jgi:hypothetical protein
VGVILLKGSNFYLLPDTPSTVAHGTPAGHFPTHFTHAKGCNQFPKF